VVLSTQTPIIIQLLHSRDGTGVCYAGGKYDGGLCAEHHPGHPLQEQQQQGGQDEGEEDQPCDRVTAGGHGGQEDQGDQY